MAAGTFPAPGTERGPCLEPCEHVDCQATVAMASAECRICTKVIGYETRFYVENGTPIHALCLEQEIEEKRSS